MGEKTKIEWTDHTFNPWIGCTKVSEGCRNCYAARDNERRKWNGGVWGPGTLRKVTSQANWREPLKWAKAARAAGVREKVFCASLADVFDVAGPQLARRDLWSLIGDTFDALDWQLLTKRPENILPALDDDGMNYGFFEACKALLNVDAAVRFVSCEPLLGAVDLRQWVGLECRHEDSYVESDTNAAICKRCEEMALLDWVICGGESGPGARPMHPDWARSLRDQCQAAGVPFFFKQHGEWKPISEMPEPEHGALYVSNKKAPEKWQQPEFDEAYGRRCIVRVEYMNFGGETGIDRAFHVVDGHGGMTFFGVGKKAAGSLLDGREWKQFPGAR